MVAGRDIEAGEVVLRTQPIAFVCTEDDRCTYCLQPGKRTASGGELLKTLRCPTCKSSYCSKECQQADWTSDHKKECKKLKDLKLHPDPVWQNVLLLSRLYRGARWARGDKGEPAAQGRIEQVLCASGQSVPVYVHSLSDVRSMQVPHPSTLPVGAAASHSQVILFGLGAGILPQGTETRGLGPEGSTLTEEQVRTDLRAFQINNFTCTDEAGRGGVGLGVYPAAALLNHGCQGNVGVTYAYAAGLEGAVHGQCAGGRVTETGADGRPSYAPPRHAAPVQMMRALRAIPAGEELTHTYVEPFKAVLERQALLEHTYAFKCSCPACLTELSVESDAAVRESLYGPPPPAPPVQESEEEREANMARARLMVTHSERIASEPELPMSASVKAQMRAEGTPIAESYDMSKGEHAAAVQIVQMQCAVLLHALKLFRRYLPPFHPDVFALVRNILAVSSLVDDFVLGEVSAAHACAAAAGYPAFKDTPAHPLLTLMEYSAVDRYLDWADTLEGAIAKEGGAQAEGLLRGIAARRAELQPVFETSRGGGGSGPRIMFPCLPAGDPLLSPTAPLTFTPLALRQHAAALLPGLVLRQRIAYGDCKLTRQMAMRAQEAANMCREGGKMMTM